MDGESTARRDVHFASSDRPARMPETEILGHQAPNDSRSRIPANESDDVHHMLDNDISPSSHDDHEGAVSESEEAENAALVDGNGVSTMRNSSFSSWNSNSTRSRNGSGSSYPTTMEGTGRLSPQAEGVQQNPTRMQRPAALVRTPSNTYAPVRHPAHLLSSSSRHRSASANRSGRDPHALYRSQEQAYVRRLRRDQSNDYFNSTTNLLFYQTESQTESELEDESPSSEVHFDNSDHYDGGDRLLLYGHDEMVPSAEELKIPENRERLEWHTMLASVLMGDVVKKERERLIGGLEEKAGATLKTEVFIGIRAKVCGRTVAAQRRMIDEGRSKADGLIDEVIQFEIQGKDKTDKSPQEQVQDILDRWERLEQLWPTKLAMASAKSNCGSPAFTASWDAIVAWNNITQLINTELRILQNWVGNEELDFQRTTVAANNEAAGIDRESSFLDRILKDDNLQALTGESNMLVGLSSVIRKAKKTLIKYAEAFEKRHLPPYVEELLVLIGFPTRLIEEVIGMRLQYAERMREPVSMMTDQLISQFQSVLQLAVKIKQQYTKISKPKRGWDLPPCMDENFEQVVLQGLKYYFKLIGWRIGSNRNTFKEAEILETEWDFSNKIGRYIEGGDIEVAEHFRLVCQIPCPESILIAW
jgi:mitogen-activated protein kinase kinase kinase